MFATVPRLDILGEKIACAAISTHLYILSYIPVPCYLTLRQLHSDVGEFNNGVCHIRKTAIADSNPDMGLDTTFCL